MAQYHYNKTTGIILKEKPLRKHSPALIMSEKFSIYRCHLAICDDSKTPEDVFGYLFLQVQSHSSGLSLLYLRLRYLS